MQNFALKFFSHPQVSKYYKNNFKFVACFSVFFSENFLMKHDLDKNFVDQYAEFLFSSSNLSSTIKSMKIILLSWCFHYGRKDWFQKLLKSDPHFFATRNVLENILNHIIIDSGSQERDHSGINLIYFMDVLLNNDILLHKYV